MRRELFLTICITLAACANYDVTLNEKVVYTPPKLFVDFTVADTTLQDCLTQTIADQKITDAKMLKRLICSNGNIRSLEGIATFSGLTQINFGHNRLSDINALADLQALTTLDLSDNDVKTVRPLENNGALVQINLDGNEGLECKSVSHLAKALPTLEIKRPKHCR